MLLRVIPMFCFWEFEDFGEEITKRGKLEIWGKSGSLRKFRSLRKFVTCEIFAGCEILQHYEIFWAFPLVPASPLLQNFDINCKNKHRKKNNNNK